MAAVRWTSTHRLISPAERATRSIHPDSGAREDGRRQQAQRDRQQIGKHPEGGIVDRKVGPDVEQVEEDAQSLPERPDSQDCRGEDDEPRNGRGRDEDVNLVRQRGIAPPKAQTTTSGSVDEAGKTTLLGYPAMKLGS